MARVEVVLDIDQTLAGGVVGAHLRHYQRRLRPLPVALSISSDAIDGADERYPKTFDVPHIIDYRAQGKEAEDEFQRVRSEIRTSPEVHLGFRELPGSVEGVRALLDLGDVSYYTVRPLEVEDATKQWLGDKGFPDSERVTICETPEDKLRRILSDKILPFTGDERPRVVLVDDSFEPLIAAARKVAEEARSLTQDDEHRTEGKNMLDALQHVTLVGFNVTKPGVIMEGCFDSSGVNTLSLPSWDKANVQRLKDQVITK